MYRVRENDDRLPSFKEVVRSPRSYALRVREKVSDNLQDERTRISTIGLMIVALLLVFLLFYWIYITAGVPSVGMLRDARYSEASIVYFSDGSELVRYHNENRTWVELEDISDHVIEALIATEDHRFYQHWGIDIRRTFSSIFRTIGGDMQGGSTITMQFARNAFPAIQNDLALTRKIKEWVIALQLEAIYEKDEILEMYLNTVPMLYNTYGFEAAARTYFDKSASELDLREAATLVGMLKGTALYNPFRNPEASQERRNVVLQQMVKYGYVSEDVFETLKGEETPLQFSRMSHNVNHAPYFAEYLRRWLGDWAEKNDYDIYTDGLRIYTTIDSELQEAADLAVSQVGEGLQAVADVEWSAQRPPFVSSNMGAYLEYRQQVTPFAYFWESNPDMLDRFIRNTDQFKAMADSLGGESALQLLHENASFIDSIKNAQQHIQVGFVAFDPNNGHVKAWVGGRDFAEDKYDRVAIAKRQPGSTFKPFVYGAAIEEGFSPEDQMRDEVIEYVDRQTGRRWKPTNVSDATGREITLRNALAYSKNTITAQVVAEIGPGKVADFARRTGIKSGLQRVPSLGLGTSEVSLFEMTAAYGTLANNGRYVEPVFVSRIVDRDGQTVATFSSEAREAISPNTAYTVLDMMRDVVDYGTGVRIRSVFGAQGDLAGKTGTTQGGADGWFLLLHPEMVMGAWIGFNSMSVSFRSDYWGQGAHNALYVVGEFYEAADLPPARFEEPSGYRAPVPRRTPLEYTNEGLEPLPVRDLFGETDEDVDQSIENEFDEQQDDDEYGSVEELNRQARRDSRVSDILDELDDDN